MFFSNRKKERERYYLLPGQGCPAARRKHQKFLRWSIVAGLVLSALMALVMYWLDSTRPF